MGKRNNENQRDKGSDTKLLYKKSSNTIFTHSRTCSGVSQLYSRSAVLQIKKNLQETSNYYTAGGKIRRDLSLETDICVLRRYYKNKRYKTSTYDSSAKSRYSTVIDTEVETIEEFPDTSACGDNDQADIRSNPNLDIATLMIENLKDLLSQWFQRHLVDNKKNRDKIDTVINVLLSQLEQKSDGSSSYSTYIVHREENNQPVKDKKTDTHSFNCQCRKRRSFLKTESSRDVTHNVSSSISLPFPHMISTLSIPRSFHKQLMYNKSKIKHRVSLCKFRNTRHNDIMLSFDQSNKFLECSSIDFLDYTSKSRLKYVDVNPRNNMTQIIFQPVCNNGTNNTSSTVPDEIRVSDLKIEKVKDIPTLLKSLYIDDSPDMSSVDRDEVCEIHRRRTFTMTDSTVELSNENVNINICKDFSNQETKCRRKQQTNNPMLTIGYINNSVEFPNISVPKDVYMTEPRNSRKATCKIKKKTKITSRKRASKFSKNSQRIQNKQFTFLYSKANNHCQGREFLKHCRSVFEYFVNYGDNRNIKLDIQVNVLPVQDVDKKDVSTVTSKPKLCINEVKRGPTLMYNVEPGINVPNLKESATDPLSSSSGKKIDFISLLDGAVSQSKYIFGTIKKGSDFNVVNVDRSTITSEVQIAQEISELRSIIKDLVLAAEKLVNENIKRESYKFPTDTSAHAGTSVSQTSNYISSSTKWGAVINLENLSKAIQCSNVSTKNPLLSGLKLSKEPKKKDMTELANRLMKKSTSYRIIDSESILRVTDMTSNNHEINRQTVADETLSCYLPKSRSLFEMTTKRNKRKVMAFFCDGNCAPTVAYEVDDCYDPDTCAKKWRGSTKRREDKVENVSRPSYECSRSCIVPISQDMECEYSTSAYSQVVMDPEANKSVEHRKGMSFCEGCFYCCLLWIPVIIIMSLFYVYVLKDLVQPKPLKRNLMFLTLSDLGF